MELNLFDVEYFFEADENKSVALAIEKTMDFFRSLGFKTKLTDYDLTDKDVEKVIKQLISHRMVKLGENRDITPEVVASFLLP